MIEANVMIVELPGGATNVRPLDDPLAGGRLLTAQLLTEFVDPQTDPLGAGNALILASGPMAATRTSTGSRLSVGCKSPLTGGIKEANAGGMAGDSLGALGFRALVFRGALPADRPSIFILDENGGRLEDGAPFWGLGTEATTAALMKKYGSDYCVVCIGQAGEQQLSAAGIAVTDKEGNPFRMAARGGVGAVMGSKGLKAVLLRSPNKAGLEISKEERKPINAFNKHVASSDRPKVMRDYGTASTVMPVQVLGGLPVRNFSRGQIEGAEKINGDYMVELIKERGGAGEAVHACMTGCVIQCSNAFADEKGELLCAPVEYETIGLCGSNLEIANLDGIARINRVCNDLGLDTIEIGAALGVMMEAAEMDTPLPAEYKRADFPRFGDADRAVEVVSSLADGSPLGVLVGRGVVATGKALGVKRIPAVKNQAMSAYDPRAVKGTAVTYATSPQGADHTAGLTVFFPVDHRDASLAVELSRKSQIQRAAYDAVALCAFNTSATGMRPDLVIDMLRGVYDVELPENWMDVIGRQVIDLELAFNRAAGLTAADDRIPDYFKTEVHSPIASVFDVTDEALDSIWN